MEKEIREGLKELAYNLWWTWEPEVRKLFRSIDPILWDEVKENPIELLNRADGRIRDIVTDKKFISKFNYIYGYFQEYMNKPSHYRERFKKPIAFFSPEYGLHHTLLIYAGGLGFLAGDILKESSDLGFPMVGIGFMYPEGYVKQRINKDGWQEDNSDLIKKENMPIKKLYDNEGNWIKIYTYCYDEKVYMGVWKADVGRTPLYLLDTDVEENAPHNREISSKLYIADSELRLKQMMVLGFGGIILLEKLGIDIYGIHINEDYPVFALLARILNFMKKGMSYEDALEKTRRTSLFTTHTPLRSAINVFPMDMVKKQFGFIKEKYGVDLSKIIDMGRSPEGEGLNTTVMAMRLAGHINGVSKKHQEVTKNMWDFLLEDEPPIDYVTNGVHLPTWICEHLRILFNKYLGENWLDLHDKKSLWELVDDIPDEELWHVHMKNKENMIIHIRERARKRWYKEKADPSLLTAFGVFLNPSILTVGFARRMTSYKRPDLIFTDPDRLARIVTNPERPVQIIFAGKAHPADEEGKELIRRIFNFARDPRFEGRIAFVEDYDEQLAHYLVRGVDVWLNNPLPPLEACGTSGMKASMNGVPHFSILDGWWIEGYNGENGWAFDNTNPAESIYEILEEKIVPLYYDWENGGFPKKWVRLMKSAIKSIAPNFCARRMLKNYIDKFYSRMVE